MPPRKAKDRIEQAARELERRRDGEAVCLSDVGRDLSEIKLNLAHQDEQLGDMQTMLVGDGRHTPGLANEMREVKGTLANYTRVVWLLVATFITAGVTAYSRSEKHSPEPRAREESIRPERGNVSNFSQVP